MLLLSADVLYWFSLGTCPYDLSDPNVCIGYFRKMYPVWLFEVIIVSLLWYTAFLLAVYAVAPRLWLGVIAVNALAIFFCQSGMEFTNHGGLNRFVYLVSLLVVTTAFSTFLFFRKIYRYSAKLFIGVILAIFFASWLFYAVRVKKS